MFVIYKSHWENVHVKLVDFCTLRLLTSTTIRTVTPVAANTTSMNRAAIAPPTTAPLNPAGAAAGSCD